MKIDFKKLDANSITNCNSKTTFGEVFTPNELINEMLDKLQDKEDTRCSKATLTTCIKILRTLELIRYTGSESGKNGYLVKNGIIEP